MTSVFLSYDRDDTDRARPLALALEKAGHSVWWDLHVRGGAQFSKVIEEALKAADAVVVLWSKDSVESAWVRDEAAAGRDTGRLVPVTLDGTQPPIGFRQFQTIDFSRWKARGKQAEFRVLLDSVNALAAMNAPADVSPPQPIAPIPLKTPRTPRLLIAAVAAALIAIAGFSLAKWWPWSEPKIATVTVRPSDPSAASQSQARDLVVQLGALRSALSGSMRLVSAASKPDLVFQSAALSDSSNGGANLILSDSNDEVLWSERFDDPTARPADLRQQIAFTAARVLRCALEESSGKYGHLEGDVRQAYLNACAAFAEIGWDTRSIVAPLRKVTEAAPQFRPGWALFMIAEANAVSFSESTSVSPNLLRPALRNDIAHARRMFPDLAEATVAEVYATPGLSIARAVALLDKAKAQDPDNPAVLNEHCFMMLSIGRLSDAVDDVQRAAQLDPLSPVTRTDLIRTLAYTGQIKAARAELARAQQIWPGTQTIAQAESTIELRYGDYEKALTDINGTPLPGTDLYFAARRAPNRENVQRFVDFYKRQHGNGADLAFGVQALGEMNRIDELYDLLATWPIERDFKGSTYVLFRPWLAGARRDPRFMQIAKRVGLASYWRQSGKWPDFCFEPDLPYDCKKEAAKLAA